MTILELPSLHQSGAAQSGRVSSGPKNTIAKRALPGSNGSCWHETDQSAQSDDVRSSGWSGLSANGSPLPSLTQLRHKKVDGSTFRCIGSLNARALRRRLQPIRSHSEPPQNKRAADRSAAPGSFERIAYFRLVIAVRSAESFAMPAAPHQLEPKPPGLIGVKLPSNLLV